ncbi:MAG: hypothetical protein N4A44_00170 [Alphaproteobacteria bacterium]|nr:hypothetical protein [Alphaproteobacteria bacterium]
MKNNMKILIILLGVSLRIFAGYNKQYYHTDDIFSFEIINDNSWAEERINEDNWNKIIDGNILKSDVEISKEEMFNFNFLEVVGNKEPHPPFYYIVLHIVQSLFVDGKFSKWPGIILNIFIYILSSVFLYKLSKFFIKKELLSLFTVFLFAINT